MRVSAAGTGRALRAGAPVAVMLALLGVLGTGCGGAPASATVPSLSGAASGQSAGSSRSAKLQAAAQCIRQHGIPGFADPVLTPSGAVYSDLRSIQDAAASTLDAVRAACGTLLVQAGFNPESEPPAPPQLVQAGVRSAQCERAHGLPNVQDPTSRTPYTPGHGFGFSGNEIPAGGKLSHGFQQAGHACHTLIDAEIRASTLSSLGSDG